MPGAVGGGDVLVGNRRVVLEVFKEAEIAEQRQEILVHHAAHHAVYRQAHGFLIRVRDEHLPHHAPVAAGGGAAGAFGAFLDRRPMGGDIGRVEVQAERQEAVLARHLQGVGVGGQAGDADRRMRMLQRLQVRLEDAEHFLGLVDVPELAAVLEAGFVAPEAQDDIQGLAGHLPVGAGHAVDVEHRPVAGQAGGGDAE